MTKHHVPEWEQRWVLTFAAEFADVLGLPQHVWAIGQAKADDGCWAQVKVTEQKRHVTIWLCEDWSTLHARDQCRSIVHEVLHVSHADLAYLVETQLPQINEGAKSTEDAFIRQVVYTIEQWVDGMALAWWNATSLQERWDEIGARLRPAKKAKRKKKGKKPKPVRVVS